MISEIWALWMWFFAMCRRNQMRNRRRCIAFREVVNDLATQEDACWRYLIQCLESM